MNNKTITEQADELEKLLHKMEVARYLLVSFENNGKYVDRAKKIIEFLNEKNCEHKCVTFGYDCGDYCHDCHQEI